MTGSEFENLITKKGYSATEAIRAFGCSRPQYYKLVKMKEVPPKWAAKAELLVEKEMGRTGHTLPFTFKQMYDMWQKTEDERRETSERLLKLMDAHTELLKTHQQLLNKKP